MYVTSTDTLKNLEKNPDLLTARDITDNTAKIGKRIMALPPELLPLAFGMSRIKHRGTRFPSEEERCHCMGTQCVLNNTNAWA